MKIEKFPAFENENVAFERRKQSRSRSIYRLVHIDSGQDEGFGRCRNISDSGAMLELGMAVALNDVVHVTFSPSCTLAGTVVWVNGKDCGISFDREIDSSALLSETAAEVRSAQGRPPRLKTQLPAKVVYDGRTLPAVINDISQAGLNITHDGRFQAGLRVKVALTGGVERSAVVRWSQDRIAGLMFLEPLAIEELGSVRAL